MKMTNTFTDCEAIKYSTELDNITFSLVDSDISDLRYLSRLGFKIRILNNDVICEGFRDFKVALIHGELDNISINHPTLFEYLEYRYEVVGSQSIMIEIGELLSDASDYALVTFYDLFDYISANWKLSKIQRKELAEIRGEKFIELEERSYQ